MKRFRAVLTVTLLVNLYRIAVFTKRLARDTMLDIAVRLENSCHAMCMVTRSARSTTAAAILPVTLVITRVTTYTGRLQVAHPLVARLLIARLPVARLLVHRHRNRVLSFIKSTPVTWRLNANGVLNRIIATIARLTTARVSCRQQQVLAEVPPTLTTASETARGIGVVMFVDLATAVTFTMRVIVRRIRRVLQWACMMISCAMKKARIPHVSSF